MGPGLPLSTKSGTNSTCFSHFFPGASRDLQGQSGGLPCYRAKACPFLGTGRQERLFQKCLSFPVVRHLSWVLAIGS